MNLHLTVTLFSKLLWSGMVTDRSFLCSCLICGSALLRSKNLIIAWIKQKLSGTYAPSRQTDVLPQHTSSQDLHLLLCRCHRSPARDSVITSLHLISGFFSLSHLNHITVKETESAYLKPGMHPDTCLTNPEPNHFNSIG